MAEHSDSLYQKKIATIESIDGLVCFWDFQEDTGQPRISRSGNPYALQEENTAIARAEGGIFGPYSAQIAQGQLFSIPRADCPELNIHGHTGVSVIAWIERHPKTKPNYGEFIAGVWDEFNKRQYGLFLNLGTGAVQSENQGLDDYGLANQVVGHISDLGTATPGYKYCSTSSFSASPIPFHRWQCVAMTYDGSYARSYLNGVMEPRPKLNPFYFPAGLYNPGSDGSDFYVGGNPVPGYESKRANLFCGKFAGLAVYQRALTDEEMARLVLLDNS